MSIRLGIFLGFVVLFSPLTHGMGMVINGDFSDGLNDWTTLGDVNEQLEEALVPDDGAGTGSSSLYQGVALAPGSYEFQFDFLGDMSSNVPPGSFPDLFSASLYFIDDINSFDLVNSFFDDVIALFDLDFFGLAPINGSAGSSPKGAGWTRWALSFNNSYNFAIPTFETFDGNFLADSVVRIDNVSITANPAQVPSPSSLILLLSGLIGIAARYRQRTAQRTGSKGKKTPASCCAITSRAFHPSGWG